MNLNLTVETKAFNQHIADFKKKSNLSTEIILKKFAFDLIAKIIRKMPVDTGQARAGWYIAFEGLGGQGTYTGKPEESEGKKKGQFIDNTKGSWKQVKYIEVINRVEYMIFLEYGYSQQAPFGMVRLSMREMRKGQLPKDMIDKFKKDWNSFY